MKLSMVHAKIHRATVTETDVGYEGSVGIDSSLLDASGILPFEAVHIWNVTRGSRLVTYAIKAPAGSGEIKTNGAAALQNLPGDQIIIAAFGFINSEDAEALSVRGPRVVLVNSRNEIQDVFYAGNKERLKY